MKTVGLITEYNPFHFGHRYHIKKAKELTGADAAVVIMSGNYVQRGEPAFMDKYTRTEAALANGADIVIELPYCFACSGAEYFAYASAVILDKLNIIDFLCFGAENDDINLLTSIAQVLAEEPDIFKTELKKRLARGMTFPAARAEALAECIPALLRNNAVISLPNNILAIEYIKALIKINSRIKPVAVKRIKAGYHDTDKKSLLYSASAIRTNTDYIDHLAPVCDGYKKNIGKTFPIYPDDFSLLLGQSLTELTAGIRSIDDIFGVTASLADRIKKSADRFTGYTDFTTIIKTKNTNRTSVSRALLHCMLGTRKSDIRIYMANGICDFIRVLGFRKNSSYILGEISKNSGISIVTQPGSQEKAISALPRHNLKLLQDWIRADNIYRMVAMNKFKAYLPNEYRQNIRKL